MIAALYAAAAVNVVVGLSCLLGPPGRVTADRAALAACAVLAFSLAELLLLFHRGLSIFGVMHLAWLQIGWVVPACGVGVLVARALGRPVSNRALAIGALGAGAFAGTVHAQFLCPRDLRLEAATLTLRGERAGNSPVRIGILADIQTDRVTDYERRAVRRLMDTEPDLILVPGDVFQGSRSQYDATEPELLELMASLHAPFGVYFAPGNTDSPFALERIFEGTDIVVLQHEQTRVQVRDRTLTIYGARDPIGLATPLRNLEERRGNDVRIVLSHYPRAALDLSQDSRVDLVVAGHTHGGQVVLPFVGPPLTLSPMPRAIGAGGLHEHRGNAIYVSRGVGMERTDAPRIRFLCPPEVTVLTLE
ncbi:MAG: phosphohydrolase [bacterium]|nr:phosphohydrolase [bacterium]